MNGLKVCVADISSAYLYAKTREKQYIIAGPEFGELEGKKFGLTAASMVFEPLVPAFMNILDRNYARLDTLPAEQILTFGYHAIPMDTTNTLQTMSMM